MFHAGLNEQLALIEKKATELRQKAAEFDLMVRIAISVEAFEAIARTLPLSSVAFESEADEHGQKLIWLAPAVVDRLRPCAAPAKATAT